MRTEGERNALETMQKRIEELRAFLSQNETPDALDPSECWFAHLLGISTILGNFSNNLSLVACVMAKEYLERTLPMRPIDVAHKPQGAPGLDFDELTIDGARVIGELKTTVPYAGSRFGAAQATSLKKDFAKLQAHEADYKFMFVTDAGAARELRRSYFNELNGVTVVCLTDPR
jgi:hypothetical protein